MKYNVSRLSNFELLRLVAIFMIIIHHLVIKSAQTCGYTHPYDLNQDGLTGVFLNSLTASGVNLFLLISGWFGVRKIKTQIIRLILDCFIYSFITNILCIVFLGYPFSWNELFYSCIFTHNWFVYAFIIFLLLSPIVERSLVQIDRKTLFHFVCLLTIVNVIIGFMGGMYRHNGYNAYNFIYLFVIGRYLHIISEEKKYIQFSKYSIIGWILCALPLTIGFIVLTHYKEWDESFSQNYFGYNNPFIILSSIFLFMSFSTMKIKSKIVNLLAKSVFGIFLLHTTTIFIYYRTTIIESLYQKYGYISIFLSAIIIFIICCFISLITEKIKAPLYNFINSNISVPLKWDELNN